MTRKNGKECRNHRKSIHLFQLPPYIDIVSNPHSTIKDIMTKYIFMVSEEFQTLGHKFPVMNGEDANIINTWECVS